MRVIRSVAEGFRNSGLLQKGTPHLGFGVFKDLLESSGEVPNSVTLISVLPACTKLCMVDLVGRFIGSR